jgi:transposase, IS30 family
MERSEIAAIRRAEVWAGWARGASVAGLARALGVSATAVRKVLRRRGGLRPPVRRRAARVLRSEEREEISRALAAGTSLRGIARQLGRAPSTISREVRRAGGRRVYRARRADVAAWQRAARPKPCRLAVSAPLRTSVAAKLRRRWSPAQIAAWLKQTYPDTPAMHVSHETIYRTLFVQSRGALKRELLQHLRRGGRLRRARGAAARRPGPLADGVSIRERPAAVEDRAVPGHWEGDLLAGTIDTQIGTLVERTSRYVLLVRLPTKAAPDVAAALARRIGTLPAALRRSLTWDRGRELAAHQQFTIATNIQVYFCDPHSPWQRGSNENTNGLLRQYFPRGTDLSVYSQAALNRIARELNQRPRKTLGWQTPADKLAAIVASTD